MGNYRQGDRSEYLGLYALSRIAFVNPAPRQEEFGILDFLCTLAKQEERLVYPGEAFFVQVKSNTDPIALSRDAGHWIYHFMALPLFVCVVDKRQGALRVYTTNNMWRGIFEIGIPETLVLLPDSDMPLQDPTVVQAGQKVELRVPLGKPIVSVTTDALEASPEQTYNVLDWWCRFDKRNVHSKSLGNIFAALCTDWKTNEIPPILAHHYFFGGHYAKAEAAFAPYFTALAHCYHHLSRDAKKGVKAGKADEQKRFEEFKERLEAISTTLRFLEAHTDHHGKMFGRREFKFED